MIRKNKLLICALAMSMVLTVMPGITSLAAEAEGETEAAVSELQDENSQRLEEVTAMDEDGTIYEIDDTDGTVDEADESEGVSGIAMFAARAFSPQVVNFNTKGNAVTNYTDETNGISGYTNGAYGADAAYLGTTSDGRIRFMLSGVTGTVSASDVQLVDYGSVAQNVSYYTVSGGKLIHYISQDLAKAPTSAVNNGTAPSYLSEGGKYYSYDGHYFYTDYTVMLSDYQSGSNGASAVNAGNPFNNYFQFLDMNLSTSYSGDELDSALNTAMVNAGIDPASSKLTGTGNSFVKYQNTYSVNALLSLGIAVNESAWGRSSICMTKNNIFGLNAVDSSPGDAYAFASIDDCTREFMNYQMANAYLKDGHWSNHGEYLGNKGGGINVSYASDPYWGEKAAAHAWNLDTVGGSKDYAGTGSAPSDDPSAGGTTEGPDTPSDDPAGGSGPADDPNTDTPGSGAATPDDPVIDAPSDDPSDGPAADTPVDDPADNGTTGDSIIEPPGTDGTTSDGPATDNPAADDLTPEDTTAGTPDTDETLSEGLTEAPAAADPQQEQTEVQTEEQAAPAVVKISAPSGAQNTAGTVTRSPKTGDLADTALWVAVLSGSAVLLTLMSVAAVRRKSVK